MSLTTQALTFDVLWWTGSRPNEIRGSRDQVVKAIKVALDQAGIEIPFPYRTLTFGDDGLKELKASDQQLITLDF